MSLFRRIDSDSVGYGNTQIDVIRRAQKTRRK